MTIAINQSKWGNRG